MNPKVTVEITERGIEVELENWEGVSNVMIERVHYAIIQKTHRWKAEKLGAMHAARVNASSSKQLAEESSSTEGTLNFTERLANALKKPFSA